MISEKILLGNNENVYLSTYILNILMKNQKRPAVIVCPGGAYLSTSKKEGEPVALEFNARGYHAFVLNYSTLDSAPDNCKFPQQLLELATCVKIIRENADKWGVDVDKLSIIGFSAGANLAANYGVYWDKGLLDSVTTNRELLKPNALLLSYPILDYALNEDKLVASSENEVIYIDNFKVDKNLRIDMMKQSNKHFLGVEELTLEQQKMVSPYYHVTKDTPATFIWHTFEDKLVNVQQSLAYARKLSEFNVPCELHVYETGHHGLSLANETTAQYENEINKNVSTWFNLAVNWLDKRMK